MTFSRYELGSAAVAMVLCGAASLACAPLERQSYGLPTTVRDQRITWHDCAVDDD